MVSDFLMNLPLWLIKTMAVALGLALVFLVGLLVSRLFRKLTDKLPLK